MADVQIDLVFLTDTEKGVLVEHGVEPIWLPRAYVCYPDGMQRGDEATFKVAAWLARKKLKGGS